MIIVMQHAAIEGPANLERVFANSGYALNVIPVYDNGRVPPQLSGIDAVVILGGPMNVDEESRYAFLREEDAFLRAVIAADIPTLGICLGAQLLAKAAGASVTKAPEAEIGWYRVRCTDAGQADPLLENIDRSFEVFQWHEDTFSLPRTAQLLVSGQRVPHQAFRLGQCVYGVQFHCEVTPREMNAWIEAYVADPERRALLRRDIGERYQEIQHAFDRRMNTIGKNFIGLIARYQTSKRT